MTEPAPYREDYDALTIEESHEQYERLQADMRSHPSYKARGEWTALQRSYDIFGLNARDLMVLLLASENDANLQTELFQNVRKPDVRDAYFKALDRALHNALAGAGSLVDHTRVLMATYPGSEFATEFEERNKVVAEEPGAIFLRRFRNYLLHAGHAPFKMSGTLSVNDGEKSTLTIWLDSDSLLEDTESWTGASRKFIQDHPEGIHLRQVAEDYIKAMSDLYLWVFAQEQVLDPEGLNILNKFVERINLTMTLGSHDGRHTEEFWKHVASNAQAHREGRPQTDWRTGEPLPDDDDVSLDP